MAGPNTPTYMVSIEHGGVSAASGNFARVQHACDDAAAKWLRNANAGSYRGGTDLSIVLSGRHGPMVRAKLQAGQRKVTVALTGAQAGQGAVGTAIAKQLATLAYGIRGTR